MGGGKRGGKGGAGAKARGRSVARRMPMTGLEAIWTAGTICSVGEIGRGLIIGQNPVF